MIVSVAVVVFVFVVVARVWPFRHYEVLLAPCVQVRVRVIYYSFHSAVSRRPYRLHWSFDVRTPSLTRHLLSRPSAPRPVGVSVHGPFGSCPRRLRLKLLCHRPTDRCHVPLHTDIQGLQPAGGVCGQATQFAQHSPRRNTQVCQEPRRAVAGCQSPAGTAQSKWRLSVFSGFH